MTKKYHQFMSDISSEELYKGLLAHGLFSEKLPPIFQSTGFFEYCVNMRHCFQEGSYSYIYYENMRNISAPRPLAIPNPMAYQLLCKGLSDNWEEIKNYFFRQTDYQEYKISRTHIRKMKDTNSLFIMNYENWKTDGSPEIEISFNKKYVVKADISSCFPSMYTHALAWALATKSVAKLNRNQDIWYNKIDLLTRHMKHDETQGILIGPHASNLLSEIILTAVDHDLSMWNYTRNIDDYTCYVESFEQAQRFLVELNSALRQYSLSINHKKTQILELPLATTEDWVRKLNSINLVSCYGKTDYILARSYIDSAIELMYKNNENASVLLYAMKVLASASQTKNAEELCARTFINLSMLYTYLLTSLDIFVFERYCTDCVMHSCIKNYVEIAYKKGLETRNFEQSAYACYYAIKYNQKIDGFSVQDAIDKNDCILLLLSYVYSKVNDDKLSMNLLKVRAEELSLDQDTYNQFWIFIYEALPMSKLKCEWKAMKRARVTFLKPISDW